MICSIITVGILLFPFISAIDTDGVLNVSSITTGNSSDVHKSVQKRWVPVYPYNSCYALAVVIAIPLELKGRNVYMSYNFETNYYYPYYDSVQGLVPLPFATIDQENTNLGTFVAGHNDQRKFDGDVDVATNDSKPDKQDMKRSLDASPASRKPRQILDHLMTRKRFYRIVESKLKQMGLNGRKCLMKSICEAAATPVNTHNGVLGDILHVVFTPSTSMDEQLPTQFHEAERRGHLSDCSIFTEQCPRSILDFISVFA